MSNAATVKNIYAAFERGDVPTILASVAEDVDWNNQRVASRECPWNGDFSGKDRLAGFFQAVGDNLELPTFVPRAFVESGDHVAVMLRIEGKLKKNGAPFQNDAVHFWTFRDGKVSGYRHFNDTAMELQAWRQ